VPSVKSTLVRAISCGDPALTVISSSIVPGASLTVPEIITTSVVPVFRTLTVIVPSVALAVNSTLVILSSSVSMNVKVSHPIHAATAMETATVTAMSMMAATTGLRAFLLFRSFFIFCSFPPFEFT